MVVFLFNAANINRFASKHRTEREIMILRGPILVTPLIKFYNISH